MSAQWVASTRRFFAYMRDCGYVRPLRMRGRTFDIIGMPVPSQARLPDNDDRPAE